MTDEPLMGEAALSCARTPRVILTLAGSLFAVSFLVSTVGTVANASEGPKARNMHALVGRLSPGATFTLPRGVTNLRQPLSVPRGVTVQGHPRGSVLRIARGAAEAFGYSFMITPAAGTAGNVTVRDFTLDGSRSRGIPDNSGGGVKAGPSWTIKDVHLSNMSYFKVWVYRVTDVDVRRNTFDAEFGTSSKHDNIGGGRARDVTLSGNQFDVSTRGNAIDLVAPRNVTVTDNVVRGAPGREHSIFLEGVRRGLVADNDLTGSSITVQGNARYRDKGDAVNPLGVRIEGNSVRNAPAHGIAIKYEDQGVRSASGGANSLVGNRVSGSGLSGMAILQCTVGAATRPDAIVGNTVVDPFARGDSDWSTGCGTVPSNGIAVTGGSAEISQNRVVDRRDRPTTKFGLFVGAGGGRVPLGRITLWGNTGSGLSVGVSNR